VKIREQSKCFKYICKFIFSFHKLVRINSTKLFALDSYNWPFLFFYVSGCIYLVLIGVLWDNYEFKIMRG